MAASTESPALIAYRERFCLALTYNNDSFVWPALLLPLKIWLCDVPPLVAQRTAQ